MGETLAVLMAYNGGNKKGVLMLFIRCYPSVFLKRAISEVRTKIFITMKVYIKKVKDNSLFEQAKCGFVKMGYEIVMYSTLSEKVEKDAIVVGFYF